MNKISFLQKDENNFMVYSDYLNVNALLSYPITTEIHL